MSPLFRTLFMRRNPDITGAPSPANATSTAPQQPADTRGASTRTQDPTATAATAATVTAPAYAKAQARAQAQEKTHKHSRVSCLFRPQPLRKSFDVLSTRPATETPSPFHTCPERAAKRTRQENESRRRADVPPPVGSDMWMTPREVLVPFVDPWAAAAAGCRGPGPRGEVGGVAPDEVGVSDGQRRVLATMLEEEEGEDKVEGEAGSAEDQRRDTGRAQDDRTAALERESDDVVRSWARVQAAASERWDQDERERIARAAGATCLEEIFDHDFGVGDTEELPPDVDEGFVSADAETNGLLAEGTGVREEREGVMGKRKQGISAQGEKREEQAEGQQEMAEEKSVRSQRFDSTLPGNPGTEPSNI